MTRKMWWFRKIIINLIGKKFLRGNMSNEVAKNDILKTLDNIKQGRITVKEYIHDLPADSLSDSVFRSGLLHVRHPLGTTNYYSLFSEPLCTTLLCTDIRKESARELIKRLFKKINVDKKNLEHIPFKIKVDRFRNNVFVNMKALLAGESEGSSKEYTIQIIGVFE